MFYAFLLIQFLLKAVTVPYKHLNTSLPYLMLNQKKVMITNLLFTKMLAKHRFGETSLNRNKIVIISLCLN